MGFFAFFIFTETFLSWHFWDFLFTFRRKKWRKCNRITIMDPPLKIWLTRLFLSSLIAVTLWGRTTAPFILSKRIIDRKFADFLSNASREFRLTKFRAPKWKNFYSRRSKLLVRLIQSFYQVNFDWRNKIACELMIIKPDLILCWSNLNELKDKMKTKKL